MKPEAFPPAGAESQDPLQAVAALSKATDETFQGWLSRYTLGLTPAGLTTAYVAWASQLALCPGRLGELALFPWLHGADALKANGPRDSRFLSDLWRQSPWCDYVQAFRFTEAFWDRATLDVPGLSPENTRAVNFAAHQVLNALSPANFFLTNPDVRKAARMSGGRTLVEGALHAFDDWQRQITGQPPVGMENFEPGKAVAVTPGKVVLRNDLMELIQYTPTTAQVAREPVLILPAWIMKYYILDLSPNNSLVRWLVDQGHTVFMVSWKNPTSDDRDKGMDDYVRDGALAALEAITSIVPDTKVHLAGYCLGGTLAMIFAAWLAQAKDERLQSLSLFAAQGDFTEAGEITVFVTDSEVAYLKNMMQTKGYLDTKQMAGAFQMLRSTESIWSHMVTDYWLGQRSPMFDLLAWNADATRMPYRMHSEYLERLFLDNQFANGHYTVLGKAIAPENITVPIFAVGTESDHVAPWRSAYKIHLMVSGEVTFVLTNGGHNAGIVSEPSHPGRHFCMTEHRSGEPYLSPDDWHAAALCHEGSWWLAWNDWLGNHGDSQTVAAPIVAGNETYPAREDAPGLYVHQH